MIISTKNAELKKKVNFKIEKKILKPYTPTDSGRNGKRRNKIQRTCERNHSESKKKSQHNEMCR